MLAAQVCQSVEQLGLNPGGCRFESCSGHDSYKSSWSSWSARHPVKVKAAGSSPAGDARSNGAARYANRQSGQAQTLLHVGSNPTRAMICGFIGSPHRLRKIAFPSAGHRRAQVTVNHPPLALQVQLLPDGLISISVFTRVGFENWPSGEIGIRATLRTSSWQQRGSSSLPLAIRLIEEFTSFAIET